MGPFPHRIFKDLPPLREGEGGQVLPVLFKDVEDDVGDRGHPVPGRQPPDCPDPREEGLDVRPPVTHRDDLPVEHRSRGEGCKPSKFRELTRQFPVVPAPEREGVVHIGDRPDPVPLDLKEPLVATEGAGSGFREHREVSFHGGPATRQFISRRGWRVSPAGPASALLPPRGGGALRTPVSLPRVSSRPAP